MDRPVTTVGGWEHKRVQSDEIDQTGLPFSSDLFMDSVPVVVTQEFVEKHDINSSPVKLDQISPFHGRSFEIGDRLLPTAVWADRYNNRYTSLSLKGNDFSKAGIMRSATAPSGYIPLGLQEDDALLRVVRASRILREHHISTEWIVGVFEPNQIAHGNNLHTQPEYKKAIIEAVLAEEDPESVPAIIEAIKPMTFFVTARAMEINDRLYDLRFDKDETAVRQRLGKIFKVYNLTHRKDPNFTELHENTNADLVHFFSNVFPTLRAKNLAMLHNAGLVHKFPVLGNVNALGGIIDLDSVHGKPLDIGDDDITKEDRFNDIVKAYDDNDELDVLLTIEHYVPDFDAFDIYEASIRSFTDTYHANQIQSEDALSLFDINAAFCAGLLEQDSVHVLNSISLRQDTIGQLLTGEFGEGLLGKITHIMVEFSHQYISKKVQTMSQSEVMYLYDKAIAGALRQMNEKPDLAEDGDRSIDGIFKLLAYNVIDEFVANMGRSMLEYISTMPFDEFLPAEIIEEIRSKVPANVENQDRFIRALVTMKFVYSPSSIILDLLQADHDFHSLIESVLELIPTMTHRRDVHQDLIPDGLDEETSAFFEGCLVPLHADIPRHELDRLLKCHPHIEIQKVSKSGTDADVEIIAQVTADEEGLVVSIFSDAEEVEVNSQFEDDTYSFHVTASDPCTYTAFLKSYEDGRLVMEIHAE